MPASLAEAGFARRAPEGVAAMTVEDGAIVVQTYDNSGELRTLRLTPVRAERGGFDWRCNSPDVEAAILPSNCRPSTTVVLQN